MAPKVDKIAKETARELKKAKAAEKKLSKKASQVKLKLNIGQAVLVDNQDDDSESSVAADGQNFAGRVKKRGRDESNLHDQSSSSIVSTAVSEHAPLSEHGSPKRKSPRKQATPVKVKTEGIV